MTLQQFIVTPPAAGTDWSWTVPGQYVARIVSVTATLSTLAHPAVATDSSGNSENGLYSTSSAMAWGAAGPYTSPVGNALSMNEPALIDQTFVPVSVGATSQFDTAAMTFETWAYGHSPGNNTAYIAMLGHYNAGHPNVRWDFFSRIGPSSWSFCGGTGALGIAFEQGAGSNATWHHCAATWDGAQWKVYIDGVLKQTVVGSGPTTTVTNGYLGFGTFVTFETPPASGANPYSGRLSAIAIYGAALSGAQIAAHYAARGTPTSYKAAVLSDAPLGFWMFDEADSAGSRQTNFVVGDGTRTVLDVPADFVSSTGSSYTWSWVNQSSGNAQAVAAGVNQVAIPDLTLDPGYTVGTYTPDLTTNDEWFAITIWADVTDSGGGGGGIGQDGYLNALLLG